MTDRELLELAAKAAGIKAMSACDFGDGIEVCRMGLWNRDRGGIFNPLTDDGDALRLAVKLRLELGFGVMGRVYAFRRGSDSIGEGCDSKPDADAAARRAIVLAAAELGSRLPTVNAEGMSAKGAAK